MLDKEEGRDLCLQELYGICLRTAEGEYTREDS